MNLSLLDGITLMHGAHVDRDDGLCVMEAVSYIAGEPHSDHPACASPIITRFMQAWNDGLPTDADRDLLLKPLIPLLIGTRTTPADEQARVLLAVDWFIREFLPSWLSLVPAIAARAATLRAAKPIQSWEDVAALAATLQEVRKEAAAVWSAAEFAAALDRPLEASLQEAWYATLFAARVAAAWAGDSGVDTLAPTTERLQASASELVKRMCAIGRI